MCPPQEVQNRTGKKTKSLFVWSSHLHFSMLIIHPSRKHFDMNHNCQSFGWCFCVCSPPRAKEGFRDLQAAENDLLSMNDANRQSCKCSISSSPVGFGKSWDFSLWHLIWPKHIQVKNTVKPPVFRWLLLVLLLLSSQLTATWHWVHFCQGGSQCKWSLSLATFIKNKRISIFIWYTSIIQCKKGF